MYKAVEDGTADELTKTIMDNCRVGDRKLHLVPMSLLVQLGSVVDFQIPLLETVFAKLGTPYKAADFMDRLDRAKYFLEYCAPDQVNRLRTRRNFDVYETLSEDEKLEIRMLHEYLSQDGYTLEELNTNLYAIPAKVFGLEPGTKELKGKQGEFFKAVLPAAHRPGEGPQALPLPLCHRERPVSGPFGLLLPQDGGGDRRGGGGGGCCGSSGPARRRRSGSTASRIRWSRWPRRSTSTASSRWIFGCARSSRPRRSVSPTAATS